MFVLFLWFKTVKYDVKIKKVYLHKNSFKAFIHGYVIMDALSLWLALTSYLFYTVSRVSFKKRY